MFEETQAESMIDYLIRFSRTNPYSDVTLPPDQLEELLGEIENLKEDKT